MDREILHIDKYVLSHICDWYKDEDDADDNPELYNDRQELAGKYRYTTQEIISSSEDSGTEIYEIIERLENHKYFRLYYNSWDLEYNWTDFNPELREVFPEQITTTIYK